jgi:nitrogen fixation protein FixH
MSRVVPPRFTGRHITAILIAFFGVVISVNVLMARLAIRSFGGEVVENSYVASQHFNRWLDEAAVEQALGWKAHVARRTDDRLSVRLEGVPAGTIALAGDARHPLGVQPDHALHFNRIGDGSFISTKPLPAGRWRLHLDVHAAGRHWRHEEDLR